jgi:hypothetical protein
VTQHGLAAADLAGDLDDAFAVGDGVDQRLEDRPAVAASEKNSVFGVILNGAWFSPKWL